MSTSFDPYLLLDSDLHRNSGPWTLPPPLGPAEETVEEEEEVNEAMNS